MKHKRARIVFEGETAMPGFQHACHLIVDGKHLGMIALNPDVLGRLYDVLNGDES